MSTYSGIAAATVDALRLSRAMTLKNAAAGLDLGGGKVVLVDDGAWADPAVRAARMRALGLRIDRLEGDYVTAEDVGTNPTDMEAVGLATRWVAGRPVTSGGRGDPSAATARTVFGAICAGVEASFGDASLNGLRVGILGAGHVGSYLARMLAAAGAELLIADIRSDRAERLASEVGGAVGSLALVFSDLDVIAPCALGGAIGLDDVGRIRARVIAGAANNQLSDPAAAAALREAGVLYVPDFIANCGGIIHVGAEVLGFDDQEVELRLAETEARSVSLVAQADAEDRVPLELAVELAEQRIAGSRPAVGWAIAGPAG